MDRPMAGKPISLLIPAALFILFLQGCATHYVSQGGNVTVTIVEGGLVETISFDRGPTFNIQITPDNDPENDYFYYPVLTIGKFSPWLGSGFTRSSNIYYEAPIGQYGRDTFEFSRTLYNVYWQEIDIIPWAYSFRSVFTVTLEQVASE